MKSLSGTLRVVPAVAAMGAMFFFAVPKANAADGDHHDCRERIEHAQARLDHAMNDDGPDSREARHARHELNEAREKCYNDEHGYWNTGDNSWHTQRDWQNEASDNGRYRDQRDNNGNPYPDNGQYQNAPNNPNYNNPNYNPNNPNNPNYNNGQYPDQGNAPQPH